MTHHEPDDLSADDLDDDYCPECFGDELIELSNGDLRCKECGVLIDY